MSSVEHTGASPFHEGELALQDRVGVKEKVARFGERGIRPFLPDEHREFLEELPFVFVASLDDSGQPWASMVWGLPGFVDSPDAETLHLAGSIAAGDPLLQNLSPGAPIGLLGIELETRRRNRANGIVTARRGDDFTLRVTQSFGNCQKYIQVRDTTFKRDPFTAVAVKTIPEEARLSAEAARQIAASDTFFIASRSAHPAVVGHGEGVDVSHRGGLPGFAKVSTEPDGSVITFPDYVGNFLFNTLGNIEADPRVGLLFVDFDRGDFLSLSGNASIVWEGPDVRATPGAQRLVRVKIRAGVRMEDALPFGFSPPIYAPQFARM
jgi:hypothetical protein